ncbi:MAG: hypothetical protein E7242_03730 [Lachnospiraceae bacterium]|nr:hypothetical protein [Lachnospiraceae bacterium]
MAERVIVNFKNVDENKTVEIEIPLDITANDLVYALNKTFNLGMNTDDIFESFLVSEKPIAFLRGNKMLEEFGLRNGTDIIYRRR